MIYFRNLAWWQHCRVTRSSQRNSRYKTELLHPYSTKMVHVYFLRPLMLLDTGASLLSTSPPVTLSRTIILDPSSLFMDRYIFYLSFNHKIMNKHPLLLSVHQLLIANLSVDTFHLTILRSHLTINS